MKQIYLGKTLGSFLVILLLMPLGHALMAIMEHTMSPTAVHYSAFLMGLVGFVVTIIGVFVKGDTKQTLYGIIGAMLFWTGWVEFLFVYYAQRFGMQPDLIGNGIVQATTEYVNGIGVSHTMTINGHDISEFSKLELKQIRGSRPEYLMMQATFGLWVMVMMLYVFCTRTGCDLIIWIQKHCHISGTVNLRPMAHHPAMVVFLEWNVMMWGCYLLLMFCYDPVFLGPAHPVTLILAVICLIGSLMMLKKQLRIDHWGRNIRFALATVIVFWTFVEICGRNGVFYELWNDPVHHIGEMLIILVGFIIALIATIIFKPNE